MSDLLGSFKDKADSLIGTINTEGGVRGAIDGLRRRMAEADRKRGIRKLRAELKKADSQVNEMINAIGVQAVGLYRAGNRVFGELAPLCEHIIELEELVENQREALAKLEAESVKSVQATATGPVCASCGASTPSDATFCPHCATPVKRADASPTFCKHCGNALRESAQFCAKCGRPTAETSSD